MNLTSDWRDKADSVRNKLKYTLTNENTHQDVVIIVGSGSLETVVKAHRFMLILGSQVFEKLLEKAEVNNEGFKEIKMPYVRPKALRFVLKYIYTDSVNMLGENALDILYVCLKLNLRLLAILCISKLRVEISVQNVRHIFEEAVKMNVPELVQASQDFIFKNARDVFEREQFLNISKENLCKLLASDELEMDEVSLFKFVLSWGEAKCERLGREKNAENLRGVLDQILPLIRFTQMESQQFSTVVVPTNILDDQEVIDIYICLCAINLDANRDIEPPQWIFSSTARKFKVDEQHPLQSLSANNANLNNSDALMTNEPEKTKKERLLQYLQRIKEKTTICGLFCTNQADARIKTIENITGVQPGILTLTMPSYWDGVAKWQSFTEEIISQWNDGFLIRIVWWDDRHHPLGKLEVFKTADETKWPDLIDDNNGHLNKIWKNHLDSIVPYFKQLQNAGVVVICDLLPYINSRNYLWRGRPGNEGSLKLYQITHDYLTQHHDLNSILWTWSLHINGDMTKLDEFYPGDNYVDIASVQINDIRQLDISLYGKLLEIVGNKPISMEFICNVPTPDLLVNQPGWAWFSVRDDLLKDATYNTDLSLRTTFNSLSVISKGNNEFFNQESLLADMIRREYASMSE